MIGRARLILGTLICALLAFPFLTLLAYAGRWRLELNAELLQVFGLTALQAGLSAALALIFGTLGALGLLAIESPRRARWTEALALLPNAAPVLLLLLAALKLFPWARGLTGIIWVHALLNTGLIAVAVAGLVRAKISGIAELAWIEGARGPRFFAQGVWPILRGDFTMLFLFVFALCFASFAVPLAIGGARATTMEVLIYQKIRVSGDWPSALGIAVLQTVAVIGLSALLQGTESAPQVAQRRSTPLLAWRAGLAFALFPTFVLIIGLVSGVANGAKQAFALPAFLETFPDLLAGSILIGCGTGAIVVVWLLALAFLRPSGGFRAWLAGYAAPSSVLTGFAILIAWRAFGLATIAKIACGLALIAIPSFYRYEWDSLLRSLSGQITVARTLGASDGLLFWRVLFPQCARPAFRLGGLAALWAWGDFALSSVVAERPVSLAMTAQGMMETYRLDAATFVVWILMVGGLFTLGVFMGVGNVFGEKSQT